MPVPVAELQDLVDQLGVDGVAVASERELPLQIREALRLRGIANAPKGLYSRISGQVFFNAAQIHSLQEAALDVIHHECFHRGLRATFGEDVTGVLKYIHDANERVQVKTRDYMLRYQIQQSEAIEEVLADLANLSQARHLTGWDRLVNLVAGWFRKKGVVSPLTDDDVEKIVAGSVKAGLRVSDKPRPQEQLSTFQRWFGRSRVVRLDGEPEVVYHGTGMQPSILEGGFDLSSQGQQGMSYGAGFYFSNQRVTAKHYASIRAEEGASNDGGNDGGNSANIQTVKSPAVMDAYLAIHSPIVIDARSDAKRAHGLDGWPPLTRKQAEALVKLSPDFSDPWGPLSNFGDTETEQQKAAAVRESVSVYAGGNPLTLRNDFYNGDHGAWHSAYRLVTGHDGVIIRVTDDENHYVAWFPEQVKSASLNSGAFDPAVRDIRLRFAEAVRPRTRAEALAAWLGKSVLREADGSPRVMYHATSADVDFDRFRRRPSDIGMHFGSKGQANDRGEYLASRKNAELGYASGARVLPVYLNIRRPLRLKDAGNWRFENLGPELNRAGISAAFLARIATEHRTDAGMLAAVRDHLESIGYDGIVYQNVGEVEGSAPYRGRVDIARRALIAAQRNAGKPEYSFDADDRRRPEYQEHTAACVAAETFRNAHGKDSYIAFRPTQVKSAVGNIGTFDSRTPNMLLLRAETADTNAAAFKNWFARSQFIDHVTGAPLVFYRGEGGGEDFRRFDRGTTRENAFFFADNEELAKIYTQDGKVRQFFLKAERVLDLSRDTNEARAFVKSWAKTWNKEGWVDRISGEALDPLDAVVSGSLFDYEGTWSAERWRDLQAAIEDAGYDGAVLADHRQHGDNADMDEFSKRSYIVFSPTQIKSATANNGQFGVDEPDVYLRRSAASSAALQQWFRKSKVVDAGGKPLVVYHGGQKLTAWNSEGDESRIYGGHAAAVKKAYGSELRQSEIDHLDNPVFFFTDDESVAAGYGDQGNHYEVRSEYLRMENPIDLRVDVVGADAVEASMRQLLDEPGFALPLGALQTREISQALRWDWSKVGKQARSQGYDGIILHDTDVRDRGQHTSYAVFSPSQIKSATGNNGDFDPANPDILMFRGESVAGAFGRWFLDSKVVADNGEPLVVYHGTDANFTEFQFGEFGFHFGNKAQAQSRGENLMPVYLQLKNPILFKMDFNIWSEEYVAPYLLKSGVISEEEAAQGDLQGLLMQKGYDGYVYPNEYEGGGLSYAVFSPTQIKSAIGSGASFDQAAPDVRTAPREPANENFERWFGDSKVVAGNGKPLVVYHGTNADFSEFSLSLDGGYHFGSTVQATMRAAGAGKNLIPVYLNARSLQRSKDVGGNWAAKIRSAKSAGRDGIAYLNRYEGISGETVARAAREGVELDLLSDAQFKAFAPEATDSYIVFSSSQIKSAIGNVGGYDPQSPDMLMSRGDGPALTFAGAEPTPVTPPPKRLFTDTPEFEKWFAGSKVCSAAGEPIVLYHGTHEDFTEFRNQLANKTWEMFSDSPRYASRFARGREGRVLPIYLSLKNPLDLTLLPASRGDVRPKLVKLLAAAGVNLAEAMLSYESDLFQIVNRAGHHTDFKKAVEEAGYDGIVLRDSHDGAPDDSESIVATSYIAFNATQIKSAIGNNGGFTQSNPSILLSRGAPSVAPSADIPLTTQLGFKRWFGESKAVDDNGKPMILYHGTVRSFEEFAAGTMLGNVDPRFLGSASMGPRSLIYFTDSREVANGYATDLRVRKEGGETVIPVYLSLQNPLIISANGALWKSRADEIRAAYDSGKYDGIILRQIEDNYRWEPETLVSDVFIAFSPTQIKSAIGNNGAFDPANPSILLARGNTPYLSNTEALALGSATTRLRLYQGTKTKLDQAKRSADSGYWFTPKAWDATDTGSHIVDAEVSFSNPMYFQRHRGDEGVAEALLRAKAAAYDALVVTCEPAGDADGRRWPTQYAVFSEDQIRVLNPATAPPQTPEFSEWFFGSKVVRPDGQPIRVYHGTGADVGEVIREGTFFSERPDVAEVYAKSQYRTSHDAGPNIIPAYLRITNPYVHDEFESKDNLSHSVLGRRGSYPAVFSKLRADGYDGIEIRNRSDLGGLQTQWVVFDASQVKSAVGNAGRFSLGSNSVLLKRGDADDAQDAPVETRYSELAAGHDNTRRSAKQAVSRLTRSVGGNEEGDAVLELALILSQFADQSTTGPGAMEPLALSAVGRNGYLVWLKKGTTRKAPDQWEVIEYRSAVGGAFEGAEPSYDPPRKEQFATALEATLYFLRSVHPVSIDGIEAIGANTQKHNRTEAAFERFGETADDVARSATMDFALGKEQSMSWPVVPAALLRRVWREYIRHGRVDDEVALKRIETILEECVARLDFANIVSGHHIYDRLEHLGSIDEEFAQTLTDSPDLLTRFIDWVVDDPVTGGWRISDYGYKDAEAALIDAMAASDSGEKLKHLDRLLNVIHMRSDLAALFIEGGTATLNAIASGDPIRLKSSDGPHEASSEADSDLTQQRLEAFRVWFGDSKIVNQDGSPLICYHRTGEDTDFTKFGSPSQTPIYRLDDGTEVFRADSWDMGPDALGASESFHYMALSDALSIGADAALKVRLDDRLRSTAPSAAAERLVADLERLAGRKLSVTYEPRPTGDAFYCSPDKSYSHMRSPGTGCVMPVFLSISNPIFLDGSAIETAGANHQVQRWIAQGYDGAVYTPLPESLAKSYGEGYRPQIVAFYPNQVKSAFGNNGRFDPTANDILMNRDEGISASAFDQWFEGSQVREADGRPMVVYHGTPTRPSESNNRYVRSEGIAEGDPEYRGFSRFLTKGGGITDSGWLGEGAYFTPDPEFAHEFGNFIMPAYVNLRRPFCVHDDNSTGLANRFRFLQSLQGFDGLIPEFKLDFSLPEARHVSSYGQDYTLHYALTGPNADGEYHLISGEHARDGRGVVEGKGSSPEEAVFDYRYRYSSKHQGFLLSIVGQIGAAAFTKMLEANGYDGVLSYREAYTIYGEAPDTWHIDEVVAFNPNQIKSAIGNCGEFSPKSDDILLKRNEPLQSKASSPAHQHLR